jgi:hypothetical protein
MCDLEVSKKKHMVDIYRIPGLPAPKLSKNSTVVTRRIYTSHFGNG